MTNGFRVAPRNNPYHDASLLQVTDDVPVFYIKGFDFTARIVIRNFPIGKHTVCIKKYSLNCARFFYLFSGIFT